MNQDQFPEQVSGKYRISDHGFQQLNIQKFLLRLFRVMHVRGTDQIGKQAGNRVIGYVLYNVSDADKKGFQ
jgi:hypothetical protein